ncbi:vomeronasal type-2 receptor 26-like [Engystomops pustulosus]|uniref:vomeronasal type-2 receptor 26-like n=1 Tax=Engystomops pustulosus TaxID=76066 RepID=UPI003AFB2B1F
MDTAFNNKLRFPYFYRTVPEESAQYEALVLLLKHFGWSWVGMVTADDESSQRASMELYNVITRSGVCITYRESVTQFSYFTYNKAYKKMSYQIQKILCNVIIFVGSSCGLDTFYSMLSVNVHQRKVIIIISLIFPDNHILFTTLHGSLQLTIQTGRIPALREYFLTAGPLKYPEVELMEGIWTEFLSCSFGEYFNGFRPCNEGDVLGNVDRSLYEVENFRHTFSVYSAVYIVAYALHDLMHSYPRQKQQKLSSSQLSGNAWKLNHYVRRVYFTTPGGKSIHLDDKGNFPARFDLVNYRVYPNRTVEKRKVGDFHEEKGLHQFSINDSSIFWDLRFLKTPHSACSESCLPGYRKVPQGGKQKCCYYCAPCAEGEISNQTNMERCVECPEDHWSNDRRDACVLRPLEFLSYEDTLGLSLSIINLFFCFVTLVVLGIFIKHKNTAIVKANNQNLSFLLLLSLLLSFLCPLLFIGRPTRMSCLLQVAFGVIFGLAVSSILSKTVTVVLAFHTIQPGRTMRQWMGRHLSTSLLVIGIIGEVLICVSWLICSPPFPDYNTEIEVGKIILQCDEGSAVAFFLSIGYIGFLAVLSFIVAFLARKLPDAFNEAQYITFSMLVFCSVWISFIPAYLSTKGKYMVAVEVFAISASGAGLLGCIFIPKCYIILLRPELNKKSHLILERQ